MKNRKIEFKIKTQKKWPKKLSDKRLRLAAAEAASEIKHHMDTDGWDIRYSHYVTEIFYLAYGVELESYLLHALFNKKGLNVSLVTKDGDLVIKKNKKRKKK